MKNPIIRTIYLYLFSLVGLALLVISAYRFVDLGLKTWVFKKAEQDMSYVSRPISLGYDPEFAAMTSIKNCQEKCELTSVQIAAVDEWLKDYDEWKKSQKINYVTQGRQRTASGALAMLIVGLPLYWYHWGLIKKEYQEKQ